MKPAHEKLAASLEDGIHCNAIRSNSFGCVWHCHIEIEISLVLRARGHRVVGDNVTSLTPGDMVMVGSNLPHDWQNDAHGPGGAQPVESICIHFHPDWLGAGWLDLPAMQQVKRLFERAALGLHITGTTRDEVEKLLLKCPDQSGLPRVLTVLEILHRLAISKDLAPIASRGFAPELDPHDEDRVNRVVQHIQKNLDHTIYLDHLAALVHLSPGAFSRFFKTRTGKTVPGFINELRIGRACRLLAETDLPVTTVAQNCGFTNLANFNRQFLRLKNTPPRDWRRRFSD
jgi:AraC-like DNA-binding protein